MKRNLQPWSLAQGLILCLLAFWPARPAAAQDITREEAIQYIATCERSWYNQAYFCKMRSARYESLDTIEQTQLYEIKLKLLVLSPIMHISESLTDRERPKLDLTSDPAPANESDAPDWVRLRRIQSFNGSLRFEWNDWSNEGVVDTGRNKDVFDDPEDLYSYYGFQHGRHLSELIANASEFVWGKPEMDFNGDPCLKAHVVYQDSGLGGHRKIRYELWLAAKGGLFPKQIIRWVDSGEGEKMTLLWEARDIEKNEQTRIWHLKEGRLSNFGRRTIHTMNVISHHPLDSAMVTPENFTIKFPPGALVLDNRNGRVLGESDHRTQTVHPETSFFPVFAGFSFAQAKGLLDQAYKQGWSPPWDAD